MGCGVGKTPVGRGQCAPPLGVQCVSAAAHTGAALQRSYKICVEVGDCPPSCQPIPVHCRGRQSGHFLEIGSLLPPPAALRRFPRRPACIAPPCPAAATHRALKTPCHCEPVRTLVWQSVLPRTAPHKGNGLPRRCAPRNDIFLVGAKHVGRAGQSRRPYASPINTRRAGCPHPAADHAPPRANIFMISRRISRIFSPSACYIWGKGGVLREKYSEKRFSLQ